MHCHPPDTYAFVFFLCRDFVARQPLFESFEVTYDWTLKCGGALLHGHVDSGLTVDATAHIRRLQGTIPFDQVQGIFIPADQEWLMERGGIAEFPHRPSHPAPRFAEPMGAVPVRRRDQGANHKLGQTPDSALHYWIQGGRFLEKGHDQLGLGEVINGSSFESTLHQGQGVIFEARCNTKGGPLITSFQEDSVANRYGLPHNQHWAYLAYSSQCLDPANLEGLPKVQPGIPAHCQLPWLTPPELKSTKLICKNLKDSSHAEPPRPMADASEDLVPSKVRSIRVAPIEPRALHATQGALQLSAADAILVL